MADEKPKRQPKVTAFVLDPDHVQASEDGMTVPPLPGLWRNDVAIHPEALGLTLAEMRDLVEALSLPLVERLVSERSASKTFDRPAYLLPSSPTSFGGAAPAAADGAPISAAADEGADEESVGSEELDVERARIAADDVHDEEETR